MSPDSAKHKDKHGHGREVQAEPRGAAARRAAEAARHEAQAGPYRKDPEYRKLLEDFQSADWPACLQGIDHLLAKHPNDKHLLSFRQEVESRSEHQEKSTKQWEVDEHERRRKLGARRLTTALAAVGVIALVAGIFVAVRSEETRRRLSAEATQTATALAAKHEMADTFMQAGLAEEALGLYQEIQAIDPAYARIDEAIAAAERVVEIEALYQQGLAALEAGDSEEALENLRRVARLQQDYKDTTQLIASISQEQRITALITAVEEAYDNGDARGVVTNYDAIRKIDPLRDLSYLDEELFASYQDLVFETSARATPSSEEIDQAVEYYRRALALFPQNIAYARQRAELQEVAIDLLASQYYLQGISMLESSDYSLDGIQESLLVLERARERSPGTPAVESAIERAQAFITAYDRLVHADWDEAIPAFETVVKREPDFADGRARYFLYEAYTARGDILMLNGDHPGALKDYQAAERLAWEDEDVPMRIFEIEARVGAALAGMNNYEQGAEFYHYAFEQLDYEQRLTDPAQAELLKLLGQAEAAYAAKSPRGAIDLFKQVVEQAEAFYAIERVTALRGDTLPNIAFQYASTLASLREANELGESLVLKRSRDIFVPALPPLEP